MVTRTENLKCEERLDIFILFNLEKRMLRGNVITVLQYWNVFTDKTEVLFSVLISKTFQYVAQRRCELSLTGSHEDLSSQNPGEPDLKSHFQQKSGPNDFCMSIPL